ncbi:MAG: D-alanyl-D-alanine carboxypeptidase family protein [Eubacteriales bacterium]|jgi:D-alanyl-D-alanine carboxypeptidase|nr:D-alanyl-D-alanine carboxypeptidase family protein [Eubacteriales bacterium]
MKRFLGILLTVTILLIPATALADYDYDSIPTPNMIVVDGDDPSVVFYARNADQRLFPASTTKIMTTLVALANGNMDDSFMVGEEVLGTTIKFTKDSSLMGIQPGETLSLRDLVYGLMLASGNDAGEAIAKHVAGSVDAFVAMMNQKAQEIGMTSTHFTNPHGVHNDEHYSTARDMAKLLAYALQNEDFVRIAQTRTYTVPANSVRTTELVLVNTDRLLKATEGDPLQTVYPYAIGGKTGDTFAAGKCLVAAAEKDGARVIIALFGDKKDLYDGDTVMTNLARFVNAAAIFEYVFANNYQTIMAAELGLQKAFSTGVVDADAEDLQDGQLTMSAMIEELVVRASAERINAIRANAGSITANVVLTTDAQAPIVAGQSMGTIEYKLGDDVICTAPLTADFSVDKVLGVSAVMPEETAVVTASPDGTPLIDKGRKDWNTGDTLTLTFVLLAVLLVALIVIFILSERKRRYERKRRARAKKRRQQYYE